MKPVLDSDVLIDYLGGVREAQNEIEQYEQAGISIISWMEVMVGADTSEEADACREFLSQFELYPLTEAIAEKAVELRKQHRIGLPDAIIWATARHHNCLLVTRNRKDFKPSIPGIRIPY